MRRPAGVTIAAVLLMLGSVFGLLMGLLVLVCLKFVASQAPPMPFANYVLYVTVVVYWLPAIWGICTAVGLLRIRNWARISALALSGVITFFSGSGLLFTFFMPTLIPAGAPADATKMVISVMQILLGIPLALSIWWLFYFNRPSVKACFLEGHPAPEGPRRPLSIVVIAWHLVVLGALLPPVTLLHFPAMLFGIILTGWAATLVCWALGVLQFVIGVGLLKLKPWSHTAAVALFLFFLLHTSVFALLPNKAALIEAIMRNLPGEYQRYDIPGLMQAMWQLNALGGLATVGIALWYLWSRKAAFLAAAEHSKATLKQAK